MTGASVSQWVERLPNGDLARAVTQAEAVIVSGAARLEDYELFVLGRQELARRAGEGSSKSAPERAVVFG